MPELFPDDVHSQRLISVAFQDAEQRIEDIFLVLYDSFFNGVTKSSYVVDNVLIWYLKNVFETECIMKALLNVEPVSLDFLLQIRHNRGILSPGCGLRK